MRTHKIVVAAAGGTLGIALVSPLAALADTAPPGTASGTAVGVAVGGQPVATVAPTSATAASGGTSSSADGVQVLGSSLDSGPGSSQNGGSSGSGSMVSTPPGSPVDVEVAPYSASSGATSAEGKAALARVNAGGASGVSANVMQSDSQASWSDSQSSGHSSSDGATANVGGSGGLSVDVLHSQADSQNGANSWLLQLNGGTPIGTSSDVGQICSSLDQPLTGLLYLTCVTAFGGPGKAAASVATGDTPGGTPLLDVILLGTNGGGSPAAGGGTGSASGGGTGAAAAGHPVQVTGGSTPAGPASGALPVAPSGPRNAANLAPAAHGDLPFTGAPLEFLLLASGALLALGGVVWKLSTAVRPQLVG